MFELLGRRALIVVSSVFFFMLFWGTAFAQNNLVATVGGIPVTQAELARAVAKIMPLNATYHGSITQEKVDEVTEKALTELIDQAYKVRYALAEEISVSNAAVEEAIEPARAKFDSDKAFIEALGNEGLNGYRATIYRELLADKAEQVAVESRIAVSDEDVRDYYEENKASFKRPKQFKASHLLVKVDPASNKEELAVLKERAEGLLERAKAGEDFYDLAYYNSDDRTKFVGGDLGYFHEGRTVKEFEEAVLELQVGEVSDLVRTRFGFHIIKLTDLQPPTQLSYDDMKVKIRAQLEKKQRDAYYDEWMSNLKGQYQVQHLNK